MAVVSESCWVTWCRREARGAVEVRVVERVDKAVVREDVEVVRVVGRVESKEIAGWVVSDDIYLYYY